MTLPVRGKRLGGAKAALKTARDIIRQICVCGDLDGDHSGHRKDVYSPPDGPCAAQGCACQRFRRSAGLVVGLRKKRP